MKKVYQEVNLVVPFGDGDRTISAPSMGYYQNGKLASGELV